MAKKDTKISEPPVAPVFSEKDKARAREWFKKAADLRERHDYDYAIECYITGLGFWPEAVEEGYMPLRSLAIQRQQAGGKKPGMMEQLKRSTTGKDAKKCMFNAMHLLSMDAHSGSYAEAMLKNAVRAGYLEAAKWVAPIVYDSLKRDKKPNKARFKNFREMLIEAANLADQRGEGNMETWMLEQAVTSLEYLLVRTPGDEDLKNEQRDLAGKLTISRGKYDEASGFRESLQDAEKQKLLHDADRMKQGAGTLESLIAATKAEWEAAPDVPAKLNAYVAALLKENNRQHENEARKILLEAYERSGTYSLKSRADEVRLRQLARQARALIAKARESKSDSDKQQARLAVMEQRQVMLEVYRERVANYPTDLRLKYKFAEALFESGDYDEAIPMLQAASVDPRSRARCQLLIGRSFFEKDNPSQSATVLREALDHYELTDDFSNELLYWLGRACEAEGNTLEAKAVYGKLLRQDYNYMDGDARQRLENLK